MWGETRFGVLNYQMDTPLEQVDDIFVVYDSSRTFRLVQLPTIHWIGNIS